MQADELMKVRQELLAAKQQEQQIIQTARKEKQELEAKIRELSVEKETRESELIN